MSDMSDQPAAEKLSYGYICLYGARRWEVYADGSYDAQQKALSHFRPPRSKRHLVSVHLAETDALALEEAEPSVMAGYRTLTSRLESSPNARRRAELETVRTITYQEVLRDKVVVGSAERVADRLHPAPRLCVG